MAAMRRPWPVTPMKRARPSSRARGQRLDRPAGAVGHLPLVLLDQVVELDEVDLVDAHALERALEAGPGAVAAAVAGLGGDEEVVGGGGQPGRQAQLGVAVAWRRCRGG